MVSSFGGLIGCTINSIRHGLISGSSSLAMALASAAGFLSDGFFIFAFCQQQPETT